LPVHVNRRELHSLEVPRSFETADSFVIEVTNHGEAGRVHIHLDEGLSDVASVQANNHYVEANATIQVPVIVHADGPVHGKVKVVSGYGATTRWVDVELTEPEDDFGDVVVDEDLAKPQPREPTDTGPSLLADSSALPVVAFGLTALLVAVGAAIFFQSTIVAAGALVVFVAVLAASYLAMR
jgi:hypothetical protein